MLQCCALDIVSHRQVVHALDIYVVNFSQFHDRVYDVQAIPVEQAHNEVFDRFDMEYS
jgi:hypothetical protein